MDVNKWAISILYQSYWDTHSSRSGYGKHDDEVTNDGPGGVTQCSTRSHAVDKNRLWHIILFVFRCIYIYEYIYIYM